MLLFEFQHSELFFITKENHLKINTELLIVMESLSSTLSESLYDLVPSAHPSHAHTTHADTTHSHAHSREEPGTGPGVASSVTLSHSSHTSNHAPTPRLTVLSSSRGHDSSASRGKAYLFSFLYYYY